MEDQVTPYAKCAHCGADFMTGANAYGYPLCHPSGVSTVDSALLAVGVKPDCYQLVTVHGEPIGMRLAGNGQTLPVISPKQESA
jgi:hypothetical protein